MATLFEKQVRDTVLPAGSITSPGTIEPLSTLDAWSSSSLLQKAIRRGEVHLAQRAAVTFHRLRPKAIWHRFMVIAFEDVGVASVDALVAVVTAGFDPYWRERNGGDLAVIRGLAQMLADVPKDRSPDHAVCAAHAHPDFEGVRERIGSLRAHHRLDLISNMTEPLVTRAVAAWYASGLEWGDERRVGPGHLGSLLERFRDLRVPEPLLWATRLTAQRTKEPICVMAPLLWLEAYGGEYPETVACAVPECPRISGVPTYAFDKHTRLGKIAIARLVRENASVRACLEQHVAEYRALDAACMAAFHADAAPVALRMVWDGADQLERLGVEADLMSVGVAREGVGDLVQTVTANLDHLNRIRAQLAGANRRLP